jgi:hypothetical protein
MGRKDGRSTVFEPPPHASLQPVNGLGEQDVAGGQVHGTNFQSNQRDLIWPPQSPMASVAFFIAQMKIPPGERSSRKGQWEEAGGAEERGFKSPRLCLRGNRRSGVVRAGPFAGGRVTAMAGGAFT